MMVLKMPKALPWHQFRIPQKHTGDTAKCLMAPGQVLETTYFKNKSLETLASVFERVACVRLTVLLKATKRLNICRK